MNANTGWAGVRERVVAVEAAERRACGLGPSGRPAFEPVLTGGEIAEAEAQFGVALPEEYRTFLTEVGVGGPGPALRLTSLRRVDGRWGWVWDDDEDHPWRLDAGGPFVETEGWPEWQQATLRAAGYEPTVRDEDNDYLDDCRKVFGDAGDEVWHLHRGRGAIHVGDSGCGVTGWLIAVGPRRGEIRERDCGVNPPFEPCVDADGRFHTFRTWYLAWLERRERAVR
ncbi:SMI1/KNR4 family protein [Streptomyces sp. 1331.2]|uniref:SMI1/KNR4 family protein n=1 Tax=Streptomyces sp. 1331.2 TaxID=1938835 RepID=UPI000BC9CD06|nr:SMI1/KNR4 family protein [Streptomyces sp. 1331.2]SOB88490.1 hypothetical protein SAMN06272789_6774 [Streptomyces sp. 1331.2]